MCISTNLLILYQKKSSFPKLMEPGIAGTLINDITEDHLGNIWLGTDSGIHKLDSKSKVIEGPIPAVMDFRTILVVGIQEDDRRQLLDS